MIPERWKASLSLLAGGRREARTQARARVTAKSVDRAPGSSRAAALPSAACQDVPCPLSVEQPEAYPSSMSSPDRGRRSLSLLFNLLLC